MDRRESIKSLLAGTLAGGLLVNGCAPATSDKNKEAASPLGDYGRTPEEIARDEKLLSETFYNEHEIATIAVLCDIILPANEQFGSATDAGVPEFIEFITKDLTDHQMPMRGGLMWLDSESNRRFNLVFKDADAEQQIQIVEDIAFPDPDNEKPEMGPGIEFFNRMRNLTLTGYYTSEMGIKDLGYQGNRPNVWDGVPEEVLKEHAMDYEPEWLAKCVNQEKRDVLAEWDDEMNLIS